MRRGFSLIEAVVVVVLLGIAIPPTLMLMEDASADRVDEVNIARATTFATGVLEQVIADAYSKDPSLGFAALGDPSTYLSGPGTGLDTRIAEIRAGYEPLGFAYSVSIGGLVGTEGVATGDAERDVFRLVTVTVTAPSAREGSVDLSVSTMVGEL